MPEEAWSGRGPCITHMHVFGCVTYTIMPDEQRGKLDANVIKYLFLDYCEENKAYRLMYFKNKIIIKNKDVVFVEDYTSVENAFEIHPSGRNKSLIAVVLDKSSKSSLV